jgi:uncharacterized membrane protein YkvA (DUF1232 family)
VQEVIPPPGEPSAAASQKPTARLRPAPLHARRRSSLPLAGTIVAAWRFFTDPAARALTKLLFLLAACYIVFPLDAVPELLLPVLGWLDDLGVAVIATAFLLRSIRPYRDAGAEVAPGVVDTTGVEVP